MGPGPTQKWAMYIDGFNFYYAIKNHPDVAPLYLSWCDFGTLANDIIGSRGTLISIKYFTAPVGDLGGIGGEEGRTSETATLATGGAHDLAVRSR